MNTKQNNTLDCWDKLTPTEKDNVKNALNFIFTNCMNCPLMAIGCCKEDTEDKCELHTKWLNDIKK